MATARQMVPVVMTTWLMAGDCGLSAGHLACLPSAPADGATIIFHLTHSAFLVHYRVLSR